MWTFVVSIFGESKFSCSSRFAAVTVLRSHYCSFILCLTFFWIVVLGQIHLILYIYIYISLFGRVEGVEISKNWHFVFEFTVLTGIFQPLFRPEDGDLYCWNTIPKLVNCRICHNKILRNRMKTVGVTVLPFFQSSWRPWRH